VAATGQIEALSCISTRDGAGSCLLTGSEIPAGDQVDRPVRRNHPACIKLPGKQAPKEQDRNERKSPPAHHVHSHANNLRIERRLVARKRI